MYVLHRVTDQLTLIKLHLDLSDHYGLIDKASVRQVLSGVRSGCSRPMATF